MLQRFEPEKQHIFYSVTDGAMVSTVDLFAFGFGCFSNRYETAIISLDDGRCCVFDSTNDLAEAKKQHLAAVAKVMSE